MEVSAVLKLKSTETHLPFITLATTGKSFACRKHFDAQASVKEFSNPFNDLEGYKLIDSCHFPTTTVNKLNMHRVRSHTWFGSSKSWRVSVLITKSKRIAELLGKVNNLSDVNLEARTS